MCPANVCVILSDLSSFLHIVLLVLAPKVKLSVILLGVIIQASATLFLVELLPMELMLILALNHYCIDTLIHIHMHRVVCAERKRLREGYTASTSSHVQQIEYNQIDNSRPVNSLDSSTSFCPNTESSLTPQRLCLLCFEHLYLTDLKRYCHVLNTVSSIYS